MYVWINLFPVNIKIFFSVELVCSKCGWSHGVQSKETKMESSEKEHNKLVIKEVNIIYNIKIHIIYKTNFVDLMCSCMHCEENSNF